MKKNKTIFRMIIRILKIYIKNETKIQSNSIHKNLELFLSM